MPRNENDLMDDFCPKCAQYTGGDSICPNCGAKIFDDDGLEEQDEENQDGEDDNQRDDKSRNKEDEEDDY